MKFTFEIEDLNNFSFSDVEITRKRKRFVTSIFSKAAFTGVFSNYNSFIFDTYMIGLVYKRSYSDIFNFFSSLKNFRIEVSHLRSFFKYNNYSVNAIDLCIKKSWTRCTSLKRLYQQYLKWNCYLLFHCSFFKLEKTLI